MAHKHSVYDTDNHFQIDGVTRAVKNASQTKTMLVQHDHNSERFTFELPRYIDGHDMSACNVVQVHYINIDSKTAKTEEPLTNSGVYEVDDLQISPAGDDVVICSWLISGNATQYVGNLPFVVRFACTSDDGTIDYAWNTAKHSNVFVTEGIYNGDVIAEEYADILAQWEARIELLERSDGRLNRPFVMTDKSKRRNYLLYVEDGDLMIHPIKSGKGETVILRDRTTDELYSVYVESGDLYMEAATDGAPYDHIKITDKLTWLDYSLFIDNGIMQICEV